MIKRLVLAGVLVGALGAGATWAQGAAGPQERGRRPAARGAGTADQGGHKAPKTQPATAPTPTIPTGDVQLGSVRLPRAVKADGKPLPAGTYEVRVTSQSAGPAAKGETPASERWAEFVQGGQVKGREVVSIISQAEISQVQKDAPPKPDGSKVETLKDGDYLRLWFNKGGAHYLIHLPV